MWSAGVSVGRVGSQGLGEEYEPIGLLGLPDS